MVKSIADVYSGRCCFLRILVLSLGQQILACCLEFIMERETARNLVTIKACEACPKNEFSDKKKAGELYFPARWVVEGGAGGMGSDI